MNRSRFIVTLAAILVLALGIGVLAGCGAQNQQGATQTQATAIPEGGGSLLVKVNPEIAVIYDKDGKVVAVEGRNDEGRALVTDDAEFIGKDCKTVVSALVAKIKGAGYIVEEVEGDGNNITIEVEDGSRVPSENFLSGVVAGVYKYTNGQKIKAKVNVEGESRYGWSDVGDSDYGPDNDGVTDYDDKPAAKKSTSKKSASNDSNYDDRGTTNYGGNTNYDDGGTTNYNDSAYGSSNKKPSGSSSSSKPSRPSNNSNYDDGGTTNNGNSNYNDNTNYGGGNTNNGNSNYDDGGNTGYDKDDDDD